MFLKRVHELLLGEHGFYEEVFALLGVPYEAVKWHSDENPSTARTRCCRSRCKSPRSSRVPRPRSPHRRSRSAAVEETGDAHRARPATYGLTIWDLDREFLTGGVGGSDRMKLGDLLGVLRDAYCRTIGVEYMHIQDIEEQRWIQSKVEGSSRRHQGREAAHPRTAQRGRGVREVPGDEVRRHQAVRSGRRRVGDPHPRSSPVDGCRRRARFGRHRHGAPWATQRARQHDRQELRADLPGVRGAHRSGLGAGFG